MSVLASFALLANGGGGGGVPAPYHPMLVNFTAALIPVSFAFDALGAWLGKEQFRAAGWWTLLGAAIATPFTALAGWLWMRSMDHPDHWQMTAHLWIGISLAIGLIALAAWRGRMHRRGAKPRWGYAAAAVLVFGALFVQGEMGASMSFGRGVLILTGEGESHDHGAQPTAEPAPDRPQTRPRDEGRGGHEHGGGDGWRDHIDVKESP